MDIAEFLTRCLDEDEAGARSAEPGPWSHASDGAMVEIHGADGRWIADTGRDGVAAAWRNAEFIVANSPARVLTKIAAKRRIIARHRELLASYTPNSWQLPAGFAGPLIGYCELCSDCGDSDGDNNTYAPWPCPELRDHASVYADRPGYSPAWAIEG